MLSAFDTGSEGNLPALVLIHAFPLDHSMWQKQISFFRNRFRVVAPDVLGFGNSKPAIPWTMEQMGNELLFLLDHLRIEKCALLGLSMGGYIALPFAGKHPERVDQLILAHTRARSDTEAEKNNRNDMLAALRTSGIEILPERMLPRLLGPAPPAAAREFVRRTIVAQDADAAIHAVTAMRDRDDATATLRQLHCPALVLTGDSDAILTMEDSRKMAEAIPDGRLAVIPNSGHLSNLENPAAFEKALAEFLG